MNLVAQPGGPFYDGGYRLPRVLPRMRQTVRKFEYPLYERGAFLAGLGAAAPAGGPGVLTAAAPVASTVTSTLITSGVSSGAIAPAIGAWAGPIGVGVGVLIGVIAGLWAKHNARVAGATHENQSINSAVQTWDQGMKAIFSAVNSSDPTQSVTAAQASTQVQQLWSTFWSMMAPYLHAPGVADSSGGGVNCGSTTLNPAGACAGTPGGHKCDSSCTATCCVACQDLYPTMLEALQVLSSPTGGSVQVCAVAGSGYGAQARSSYTLTYTPPAILGGAGASVSSLTSDLSSLFGGSTGSGGSSFLPILAIGALAFFLMR